MQHTENSLSAIQYAIYVYKVRLLYVKHFVDAGHKFLGSKSSKLGVIEVNYYNRPSVRLNVICLILYNITFCIINTLIVDSLLNGINSRYIRIANIIGAYS